MKKEQLLDLYYQMVLIRRVEERGAELYQAGKIGGFMHLYIGQEAVSTGLIAAREPRHYRLPRPWRGAELRHFC